MTKPPAPAWDPAPRKLSAYAADALACELSAFKRQHGDAFFVWSGKSDPNSAAMLRTVVAGGGKGGAGGAMSDYLVLPVSKPSPGQEARWTVGRAKENDVVVPDASVSAFHAVLRVRPNGHVHVEDGGSRNGTFVGATRAPPPGQGDPPRLVSGGVLKVGHVELVFADGFVLQGLARHAASAPARP